MTGAIIYGGNKYLLMFTTVKQALGIYWIKYNKSGKNYKGDFNKSDLCIFKLEIILKEEAILFFYRTFFFLGLLTLLKT